MPAKVTFTGKFFEKDPGATLDENIRAMMGQIASDLESAARADFRAGEGSRYIIRHGVGRTSRYIRGRTQSLRGRQWGHWAVVSVDASMLDKKRAISLMAAASWLESQNHIFRRLAGRVRYARADLAAGLE